MTVDPARYRDVIGRFPTGVAVVTTADSGVWFGMTANALASVSLDPVTLLVCFGRGTRTGGAVARSGVFAINLLAADQRDLAARFARPGDGRFAGLPVDLDSHGVPILPGALAHLVCRVAERVTVGDHEVVFGRVEACQGRDGPPLVYFRRGYRALAPECPADDPAQDRCPIPDKAPSGHSP